MMERELTPKDAYVAMYLFLSELYERAGYDQLGGLLGGMSLLDDGTPADPGYWDDWLRMVEKAKSQRANIRLDIKVDRTSTAGDQV
jgi:hypothetical protein